MKRSSTVYVIKYEPTPGKWSYVHSPITGGIAVFETRARAAHWSRGMAAATIVKVKLTVEPIPPRKKK